MPQIIVIGASHAGISFADRIRQNGFQGNITLIDKQRGGPLERPPLSKAFLLDESEKINPKYLLKRGKWYKEQEINLKNNSSVINLDVKNKYLTLNDGERLDYDKLVLATGALPRNLPSAQKFSSVFVLRQPDHAVAIRNAARVAKRAVIIGGGYIGLEVAASLRQMELNVSVIELEDRLLARVASPPIAERIANLHETNGVSLYTGMGVTEILDKNNIFTGVVLSNGETLAGDMLLIGIGVVPDSALAFEAGIETENTTGGAIMVDEFQKTSDPDIYAIGDVALQRGSALRIESVDNAQSSAARAAARIMGKPLPPFQAPWFWSDQYDANLQSVGIVPTNDSSAYFVARGDNPERGMSFWSYCGSELIAVEAIRCPKHFLLAKRCLDKKVSPDSSLISDTQYIPDL